MKFFFLTIFPSLVECFCEHGIVSQAIKKGALEVVAINPRDYAEKGRWMTMPTEDIRAWF
jgi:tRNA (guanine37-N1)-methyltransferase